MVSFLRRLKNKIIRVFSKPKSNFDENLNLFWFKKKDKLFYSNTIELFEPMYNNIFLDEIYSFQTSNPNSFIVDCGSNIGLAVGFWKERFPDSRIICFEPDPEVFRALAANTQGYENVFIHQMAVSNRIGEVEFTSNGKLSGSLNLIKNLPKSYKVKTDLLSNYIKDDKVDMLKIDIEGEELNVMYEIEPYLNNVQNIFVEYHAFINESQRLSELLNILEKAGFRYYLDSELKNSIPLIKTKISLNQDLQVNIWGKRR